MKLAKKLGVKCLRVFIDSQLMAGQVIGEYEALDLMMAKYLIRVQTFIFLLKHFGISHIF